MWRFVIRRMLLVMPTLLLVLALLFVLSRAVPGDPVKSQMMGSELAFYGDGMTPEALARYDQLARELGLDLPYFYFSVRPRLAGLRIEELPLRQQRWVRSLLRQRGDPLAIADLRQAWQSSIAVAQPSLSMHLAEYTTDIDLVSWQLKQATTEVDAEVPQELLMLAASIERFKTRPGRPAMMPTLVWHGRSNQFHRWMGSAVTLDFGRSRVDGRPVGVKIGQALRWTLVVNLLAILLAYTSGILTGVYVAWRGDLLSRWITVILYLMYAMPVFWLTTLLVVFFTTDEFGWWTNIFPAVGIWQATSNQGFFQVLWTNAGQLIIPMLVLGTTMSAYIARLIRNSVLEEKQKAYVWYARSKGLTDTQVLWKHVWPNASYTLITTFAAVLPSAIAGSVVVEVICSIPGMGRLMYDAIGNQDWAVVMAVVMITSVLTIVGLLCGDVLYRLRDPRIRYA